MNQIQDRPSGTWQVTGPGQQAIAYVAGQSYAEARAAVRRRPDLRDIARRGFSLRRLREQEAAAGGQWILARHPGDENTAPWPSYSVLLADGSYLAVTPGQVPPSWQWAWHSRRGVQDAPQMTVHGFWTAQDAMADAGDTASLALARHGQRWYVACWAERKDPAGRGAASSWVPMPFPQARAALIADLERNLGRWAGTGGSDPARYSDALQTLKAATGPVTIDLPGHVLSITEVPEPGR